MSRWERCRRFVRTSVMRRYRVILAYLALVLAAVPHVSAQAVTEDSLRATLSAHASPLQGPGEALLLKEAREHQYFLLGELHGENEIPELLGHLWPSLWRDGYRHMAAEVSPWAATHLENSAAEDATPVWGLWTRKQAGIVRQLAAPGESVLWGCDIEEEQPDRLIRQVAQLNPEDAVLRKMTDLVSRRYNRSQAPALFRLSVSEDPRRDEVIGGESLWESTLDTLRVESLRAEDARYAASDARELIMKKLFLSHSKQQPEGKVLLRFGRNHLHRGYDARGISTLGNFVEEWALAQGRSVFNVGVFAAGGKEWLAGQTFDADERQDEATFALLASLAGQEPTLFDLRFLRPVLRSIPQKERTNLEVNLIYWADSYDFLLCYPTVTPLMDSSAESNR
jgi:hypothetical protein